jgi:hypothetical protein
MITSSRRSGLRIAIAALTVLLSVASFQSSAGAATATPKAPAGNAFTEIENYVTWVYWSVLFREPDEEGFTYWTNHVEQHGADPFVFAVVESEEWRQTWVDYFYSLWLDRSADQGGLDFWSAVLADHSFDSFESFVGGSDEAYEVSGGTDEDYVWYVHDAGAFRDPTDDEVTAGLEVLATPAPRSDYVSSILHSENGLASRVEVAYGTTLDREPDADGAFYWMGYYHETGRMDHMLGHMLLSDEAWDAAQNPPTTRADLGSLLAR